jgi:hypothetical protein
MAEGPDRPELLTALTTEHFTLQGARSQTVSESASRASLYVMAVSSALVGLGFIGQVSEVGDVFDIFALTVLPTLCGSTRDPDVRASRPSAPSTNPTSGARGSSVIKPMAMPSASPITAPTAIAGPMRMRATLCRAVIAGGAGFRCVRCAAWE